MHTSTAALRERNRALMHPRNRYKERPPDFAALARTDEAFAKLLQPASSGGGGIAQLDWSTPQAALELCRVLLWHDFGVRWEMPPDRLSPTVPSRLNYLLWLEDLLAPQSGDAVLGVDIGTGASCIYPLLGRAQLGWRFLATDIDPASVAAARHNVALNGWEAQVEVREVGVPPDAQPRGAAPLLCGVLREGERAAFCMCNPPFYDEAEAEARPGPAPRHAPCAGSRGEQFTPGGEVGFVLRLVRESQQLGAQVGWYTSLLGRKASLRPVLRALRKARAPRVRTAELAQGVTLRWVVAWSFASAAGDAAAAGAGGRASERRVKTFAAPAVSEAEVRARIRSFLGEGWAPEEDGRGAAATEAEAAIAAIEAGASAAEGTSAEGEAAEAEAADEAAHTETVECLARGRLACTHATGGAAGGESGGEADGFVFEVRLVRSPSLDERGDDEAVGDGELSVQVHLCEGHGAAAASFWAWAERMRNDVVRDTRKWRRLAARTRTRGAEA